MTPTLLPLPKIEDARGNLSFIESNAQVPFTIRRTYWIYDVPGGCDRGEHAYKKNQEFIVALSGSFDVELDNGESKQIFQLNRSYRGLYVPAGTWRRMTNFSTNSLALVLASEPFDGDDYITDYTEFRRWKRGEIRETHSPNVPDEQHNCFNGAPQPLPAGKMPAIDDCAYFQLTRNHNREGNLTYIYENVHVPFPIRRAFYIYDIPAGAERGGHAHKECHQLIVAASGSFEVKISDGRNERTVTLNRPFMALHLPPGVWASEQNYSSGSICLVLTSHAYDNNDYIRDFDEFLNFNQLK